MATSAKQNQLASIPELEHINPVNMKTESKALDEAFARQLRVMRTGVWKMSMSAYADLLCASDSLVSHVEKRGRKVTVGEFMA